MIDDEKSYCKAKAPKIEKKKVKKDKQTSKQTFFIQLKHECVNISFPFRALCVPWWNIFSIDYLTVSGREGLSHKRRSWRYFHCLGRVMKCGYWKSRFVGISYSPMLSTPIITIGYNLQVIGFPIRNKTTFFSSIFPKQKIVS